MRKFYFNTMTTKEFYELLYDETVSERDKDELISQQTEFISRLSEDELEDYLRDVPYRDQDSVWFSWQLSQEEE